MKKESNSIATDKNKKLTGKAKITKKAAGVSSVDLTSTTEKMKPNSGKGLANEGTIVSYDEER